MKKNVTEFKWITLGEKVVKLRTRTKGDKSTLIRVKKKITRKNHTSQPISLRCIHTNVDGASNNIDKFQC